MIRQLVKLLIDLIVRVTGKTPVGQYFHNQVVKMALGQTLKVSHGSLDVTLATPNALCRYRAETFSTKEPETLEWIDGFPEGVVLWDIGANIGLYSIYAAKQRKCRVWAFEPSVFNLECLAKNVFLNEVTDRVCLVPLALNDGLGPSRLHMTSTDWGGALSTFGQDYGHDGKKLQQVFEFQVLGLSMEDAVRLLGIPQPDYIKMDVDGIEHLILKGGIAVMRGVKGILIEVNDDFHELAEQCQQLLASAGLNLREKVHAPAMAESPLFKNTYNQIWHRSK